MQLRSLAAAALALALPLAAGCRSDEPLNAPDLSNNAGLLARYVSMGNSITAGFQSGGINDSTQAQSYAVLFAEQAGAPFFVPFLNKPGCPAPLSNNVTQARVGSPTAPCALRNPAPLPFAMPYVSNVAVPGATSFSPVDNALPQANSNALTTFILGGRTQLAAMAVAQPTFVTVWFGNNDVLGALTSLPSTANPTANPGNVNLITPQAVFEANYTAVLDSIEAVGAQAALFSVADVSAIPYASSGSAYWCIKNQPLCGFTTPVAFPPALTVDASCAPASAPVPGARGDQTLIPWPIGITKLQAALAGQPQTITCVDAADAEIVTPAETQALQAAVQGYNAFISAQAAQREWAYVDISAILLARKASGQIPSFPDVAPALSGGSVGFGPYFSLDGVHPSAFAHREIADSLIAAVNRTYETEIPFAGQ